MKEYLDVLQEILDEGIEKESGRANMPNTIGIEYARIRMDLREGFPLLTTKKMYWKGIVCELLWFLRGETNIKYLVDNKVNIWNGDAYRWYLKYHKIYTEDVEPMTMEEFVNTIKTSTCDVPWFSESTYRLGDLGKVYGFQWRNQNGVDQLRDVVEGLQKNPYSRYHIIDAWNKADFVDMALPPCHLLYQFIVRPLTAVQREDWYAKKHGFTEEQRMEMHPNCTDEDVHELMDKEGVPRFFLNLNMYQRSCDIFLGVPFNLGSMSLLLTIIAEACNMIPAVANWIGGDVHMYVSHRNAVVEQLGRMPTKKPRVVIARRVKTVEDICNLTTNDIILKDYVSQDKITAELFTGLKKK